MRIYEKCKKQITEGIVLVNGVKLRPSSKNEIRKLGFYETFGRFSSVKFALEKRRERPPFDDINKQDILNTVLALRLTKEGDFSAPFVFEVKDYHAERYRMLYPVERERINISGETFLSGHRYILDSCDISKLNRLLKELQRTDFNDCALRLACSRFERSYVEDSLEDQLMDLMIGFEALFLKGERTWEKRKRIALKCSQLLGKNKRYIQNLLEAAYERRNVIVHGSDADVKELGGLEELDYFIFKTRNLLRESIKKTLLNHEKLE